MVASTLVSLGPEGWQVNQSALDNKPRPDDTHDLGRDRMPRAYPWEGLDLHTCHPAHVGRGGIQRRHRGVRAQELNE